MGIITRGEERDDRLVGIGWALTGVVLVTLLSLSALLSLAVALLGPPRFEPGEVDLNAYLDVVKIVLGVVAGLGGIVALVVAYRRQRIGEQAEAREQAGEVRERARLQNERYETASRMLGDDKAAVRLAGVHAMANLADDWGDREGRQRCIDVLCSYCA